MHLKRLVLGLAVLAAGLALVFAGDMKFDAYQSTDKPIKGPLMVLAGDDDHSVAIANIEKGVREACRLGPPIEFRHRPGLDHDSLMEKTIGEQLAWTRDRLDGRRWAGNCPH